MCMYNMKIIRKKQNTEVHVILMSSAVLMDVLWIVYIILLQCTATARTAKLFSSARSYLRIMHVHTIDFIIVAHTRIPAVEIGSDHTDAAIRRRCNRLY